MADPKKNLSTLANSAPAGTGDFFPEISRMQQLDLIYSVLCYRKSVVLLTGPTGAGKTTLLRALLDRMVLVQPTAFLGSNMGLELAPLLEDAQEQLTHTRAELPGATDSVFLIDDADLLGDSVLRKLMSSLGVQSKIVFAGIPGLSARITALALSNEVTHVPLRPFSEEETARFVRTRLEAAGILLPHPILEPASIQRVYQESGGWPGGIIRLAQSAWIIAKRRTKTSSQPTKKGIHSVRLWLGISAGFSILLGFLLFWENTPIPATPPVVVAMSPLHHTSQEVPRELPPEPPVPPTESTSPLAQQAKTPTITPESLSPVSAQPAYPLPQETPPHEAPKNSATLPPQTESVVPESPTTALKPVTPASPQHAALVPVPTAPAPAIGPHLTTPATPLYADSARSKEWLLNRNLKDYTLQVMVSES
ncbi:hypothetical protein CCP3SC1AL1_3120001 [Gammaproteobacteria bacterium]